MASAFQRATRPGIWYANFSGLWQAGTKRTVLRVPPSRAKSKDDAGAAIIKDMRKLFDCLIASSRAPTARRQHSPGQRPGYPPENDTGG